MAQSLPLPADTMVGSPLPALAPCHAGFAGSLLLAAKVKAPLWSVPVTLQTRATPTVSLVGAGWTLLKCCG